ncbi:MAG TPA: heme exporter protein CcmD [Acidocella sp.]|nr:heme exporter protein CcmD [Acidocella sp.]
MNLVPFIDGSYGIAAVFLVCVGFLTFTRYRRAVARLRAAERI